LLLEEFRELAGRGRGNSFLEKMTKIKRATTNNITPHSESDFMRLGYLVLILFLGFCVIAIYHAL
jgi:hypothetical protein